MKQEELNKEIKKVKELLSKEKYKEGSFIKETLTLYLTLLEQESQKKQQNRNTTY